MVNLQNIRNSLIGFILAVAMIVIFNQQINEFANLIQASEARVLVKTTILVFFITIGLIYPIGIGSKDMQKVIQ